MNIIKKSKNKFKELFWKKVRWEFENERIQNKYYGEVCKLPYVFCAVYAVHPFDWLIKFSIEIYTRTIMLVYKISFRVKEKIHSIKTSLIKKIINIVEKFLDTLKKCV
jgi:hypothetical protein